MKWLFAPMSSVGLWRNKAKVLLAGATFMVPLVLALVTDSARSVPVVVSGGIACYVFLGLLFLSDSSWKGIEILAGLLQSHDLRESSLPAHQLTDREKRGKTGNLLAGLRNTHRSLREFVREVQDSAGTTRQGAELLAGGTADLSDRTDDQASTLEETAAAMEQLATTVRQNAQNCRSASELTSNAAEVARQGAERARAAVSTMELIDHSSKRIVDIIAVIEGISFQTNILALNAAVEAARAGEQGRGFAVVAEEVRNLARSSAEAAKEIKELIAASVSNVEQGSRLVHDAGRIIGVLAEGVEQVNGLIKNIATSSGEQATGVDSVNTALMQLQGVTQKNSTMAQEAARASQAFNEEAARLFELVRRFRIDENGKADRSPPPFPLSGARPRASVPRIEH
jgi:methyl-accepting chemotaxis protein